MKRKQEPRLIDKGVNKMVIKGVILNVSQLVREATNAMNQHDWVKSCNLENIDISEYFNGRLEYWVVNSLLASELKDRGEKVIDDLFGLTIWCRTTTGQSIAMDDVILNIYSGLNSGLTKD